MLVMPPGCKQAWIRPLPVSQLLFTHSVVEEVEIHFGQGQDVNYCPVGEAAGVAKFPYPAQRPPLLVYSLISPSSRPHRVCCCCMVAFMAGVVNNKADPPLRLVS